MQNVGRSRGNIPEQNAPGIFFPKNYLKKVFKSPVVLCYNKRDKIQPKGLV